MNTNTSRTTQTLANIGPNGLRASSLLGFVVGLLLIASSGCVQLRLPAIDPTGQRIFTPLPTTTGLALPGSAGERSGLFGRFCNGLRGTGLSWPTPAFQDPAAPPECLTPVTPVAPPTAINTSNEPCVPSVPCTEDCKNGPPAVLYGREVNMRDLLTLPNRGERGCILLSPQKIVAPVGGEVVLLSGICGDDGYLQVAQPLEWMLTPDSVGTFLQVGDDDPGLLHRLARVSKATKQDPSYALGVTSTKRTLITRGNLDPRDDVQLEKGQTWITLSSPSEGTSHVTVLAPESDCWDNRKATATIYWIDARWVYPSSKIEAAGNPVELSTRVTRSEGALPAKGWKVRYTIMEPGLATFAGTNGSSVVEAEVNDAGNAVATLLPTPGTSGTAAVGIEIIRPGGVSDNIPDMTLSRGQTFVTWSAPQLSVKAGAPSVASFNQTVQVVANIRNEGNQPAENVVVTMRIPDGVIARSDDGFAQNVPSAISWNIGTIPPQQELDVFANVTAQSPIVLTFEARADAGLVAADSVQIDVYRPSLLLSVKPEKDRYETGEPVTFNVDIKNTGDRPLADLQLVATGDGNMVHEQMGKAAVTKPKTDGPLQPGDTWPVAVTFVPTDSGRRCINVTATASGGQHEQSEQCVTVINPVPPTPALTAKLERRNEIEVSDKPAMLRGRVTNTGEIPLTNVRVTMTHDPQLRLIRATNEGLDKSRLGQFLVAWNIPSLAPGESRLLEAEVQAVDTNQRSQVIMTARADEGALANDNMEFAIVPGLAPRFGNPDNSGRLDAPALPPATAAPSIPTGPPPIPDPSATGGNVPSGPATNLPTGPQRSNQLVLSLAARDNPALVNKPIRYTLRVTNDTDVTDSQVSLRFVLPPGVSLVRVVQRRSPELGEYRNNAGIIEMADIKSMRPGESIDYELELQSNQPQTFDLEIEGASRQTRGIARASSQTTVIP
ncbi:MAG: hypothetical protein WBD20_17940 [Pirellulaceae bacterium]